MAVRTHPMGARRAPALPRPVVLLALAAPLLALAATALGMLVLGGIGGAPAAPARTITISAEGGRFEGSNPTIELRAGETVALTIVNREAAMVHNFVVGGLKVRTRYLEPGESETVVLTPERPGVYQYTCTLHPGLMDGRVVVR